MLSTSESISIAISLAAVLAVASLRLLRMAPSFGSLHIASVFGLLICLVLHFKPGLRALFVELAQSAHMEWIFPQVLLPLWLFASAISTRAPSGRRMLFSRMTFSICGTVIAVTALAMAAHLALTSLRVNVSWWSCIAFGALASAVDPCASHDFVVYSRGPLASAAMVKEDACIVTALATCILLAVNFVSAGALPTSRLLVSGAAALVGGVVIGVIGALLAYMLIAQVPTQMISLTIALALGTVTVASVLSMSAVIAATTAALGLRYLLDRGGVADAELLPGTVFWGLLDMVWAGITVVIVTVRIGVINFNGPAIVWGFVAWFIWNGVESLIARALATSTARQTMITKCSFAPGAIMLMLASYVPTTLAQNWLLPACYSFVFASLLARPGSFRRLRMNYQAGAVMQAS